MTPQTPTWRRHKPHKEVYPFGKERNDGYGFWFSEDLSQWCGSRKKSSAERMAEYRRRKKAGEVVNTRKHGK